MTKYMSNKSRDVISPETQIVRGAPQHRTGLVIYTIHVIYVTYVNDVIYIIYVYSIVHKFM